MFGLYPLAASPLMANARLPLFLPVPPRRAMPLSAGARAMPLTTVGGRTLTE